ncbi:hypothetical protein BVRB_1g010250 [Beta vulgaris subsp. vulgaris]|nr:hypothetical protein BVRB_1g010250 [Beta vulgaris subsp. vulgaris]
MLLCLQCYATWFGACPGLKVLAPYSAEDARGLLKAAIRDPDPVVFLENELLYGESFPVADEVLDANFPLPIGKAKVEQQGKDVTITAFSKMVGNALKVILCGLEAGGGGLEAAGDGLEAGGGGEMAGDGVVHMVGFEIPKEIFVEGEDGAFTRFMVQEEWDHTLIGDGHEIRMSPCVTGKWDPEEHCFLIVRGAY